VTEESGEPPQIIAVSPTEGDSGTEVTFTAEVTGDGPFTYYWDFGGGASPNQSSGVSDQPSATVTLSRGGTLPEPVATYPASLTVTNSSGTAIHDFNLSISAWWHLIEIPFEHVHAYALTPDGKPALLRGTETEVVYCVWNSGYWEEEVIPRATYKVLAHHPLTSEPVAVGSAGGETSGTVVYSWRSGAQWYQEEIEYAGWVAGIDLAFHQDGSPVVCWGILGDPFALKVAERTPEDWMIETVPTEGQDPRQPVLAVGGEDNIAVVYGNSETPGGVWIARKQATTWEISEAIPEPSSGQEMATAPDGALVLVVRRSFAHTTYITYAEETPSGWNLEDIDTSDYYYVNTVAPSFLADGEPVIAYGVNIGEQDEPVYEVRVVWRDTEAWNLSVPFPPEGNTSSWGGSLIGVSMDGTVALTVGEHDTSSNYYALFW
ncbi:PKD domain-containing protein, partial [bacterium]|nr:PKD domain-containing protein [bacterium]